MNFDYDACDFGAKIKVIGVGGAGNNAVNRMVESGVQAVDFIAVNTDKQALHRCAAPAKILIGEKLTRGRGAGANPEVGRDAAEENIDDIKKILEGTDMVFITAGMGGGTGTGAAPVIAKLAKDMGVLTVGVVTKPFAFEGKQKMGQAEGGIANLKQYVDSMIIIPNERLKFVSETGRLTIANAFQIADDVLRIGIQRITDLINVPSFMNLDFNDVSTIMKDAGLAHMGFGTAQGKDKAEVAAKAAISSPLLETAITGSKGVIINLTVSPDIGLDEVEYAASLVEQEACPDAKVIWGVAFDETLEDEMKVTVVATGFEDEKNEKKYIKTAEEKPADASESVSETADKPKNDIDDTIGAIFGTRRTRNF